jgi:hypothetical protein
LSTYKAAEQQPLTQTDDVSSCDDAYTEFEEALVDVGAAFVADTEAAHAVEPGEGALDDVADLAIFDWIPRCRSRRRTTGKS